MRLGLTSEEAEARLRAAGTKGHDGLPGQGDPVGLPAALLDPPILAGAAIAVILWLEGRAEALIAAVALGVVWLGVLIKWVVASRAIAQAMSGAERTVTVLRDGAPTVVPVGEVVEGDAVLLAGGTRAPAPLTLVAAEGLAVAETRVEDTGKGETIVAGALIEGGSGIGLAGPQRGRAPERADLGQPRRSGRWSVYTRAWLEAALMTAFAALPAGLAAAIVLIAELNGGGGAALLFLAGLLLVARPGTAAATAMALAGGLARADRSGSVARSLDAFESLGLMGYVCTDKATLFDVAAPRDAERDIAEARRAKVRIAILTDAPSEEVDRDGRELGLISPFESAVTGNRLDEAERRGEPSLDNLVRPIRIFSETAPRHLALVIGSYRRDDHLVGATLRGPADDPAFEAADLAIAAHGTSSDYALERAGIVLEEPRIGPLLGGVGAARGAFARLRRHMRAAAGTGLGLMLVVIIAPFLVSAAAIAPEILLALAVGLALLADTAMAFERDRFPPDARSPRRSFEPIQNRDGRERALLTALLIGTIGLAALVAFDLLGVTAAERSAGMLAAFASLAAAHLCISAGERPFGPVAAGVPNLVAGGLLVIGALATAVFLPEFGAVHLTAPHVLAIGLVAGPALLLLERLVRRAPRKSGRIRVRRRIPDKG